MSGEQRHLTEEPRRWCVTGVAGFIGSHLLEELLRRSQIVVGLDNLSTGRKENLEDVRRGVGQEAWQRFQFIEGDLVDRHLVARAFEGADYVLHQAALGSVPLSLDHPDQTHAANVDGFLNVLLAARTQGVKRLVYASSSAVYGDVPDQPAREDRIGEPLSPYALSKRVDEQYAAVFARCFRLSSIGLRYFNVFGPRQDPNGAYAAVIPRWIQTLLRRETIEIFGDGETTRDFCPVANIVQANLLAALADPAPAAAVFNVGLGQATSLKDLARRLRSEVDRRRPGLDLPPPAHRPFRSGDVRHSRACLRRLEEQLAFRPVQDLDAGLAATVDWYAERGGG